MVSGRILSLLGDTLVRRDGTTVSTGTFLTGKSLLLYFSAHWCPPCRQFTPVLKAWYESHASALNAELIFCSADRSEAEFRSYFESEMGDWLAVPYDAPSRMAIGSALRVEGIPALITISAQTNKVVSTRAREGLMEHPEEFPWTPRNVMDILFASRAEGEDEEKDRPKKEEVEKCEVLGLLFSASWCGPCRKFLPILTSYYEKVNAEKKRLEIVFVSADNSEAEYEGYKAKMPWKAIGFQDGRDDKLSAHFRISGIPSFILLDPKTGRVISDDGVQIVAGDVLGEAFPYEKKDCGELSEAHIDAVQSKRCVFLFAEGIAQEASVLSELLGSFKEIKTAYAKYRDEVFGAAGAEEESLFENDEDADDTVFAYVSKPTMVAANLRRLFTLDQPAALVEFDVQADMLFIKDISSAADLDVPAALEWLKSIDQGKIEPVHFVENAMKASHDHGDGCGCGHSHDHPSEGHSHDLDHGKPHDHHGDHHHHHHHHDHDDHGHHEHEHEHGDGCCGHKHS
eukprot:ANDGO_02417.mRNA.1 putative nucleoredoxin 3